MCLLMRQLFVSAMNNADRLALGEGERNVTRWDIFYWTYSATFAVLSILIALFVPDGPWIPLAGYIYFVMLFGRPFLKRWF